MIFSLRPVSGLLLASALAFGFAASAHAQLDLPGATAPDPAGTPAPAVPRHKTYRATGGTVAERVPSEDSVVGHSIYLNGIGGEMQLDKIDAATLKLSKLSLAGDKITSPAENCKVDIASVTQISAHDISQPGGLHQFQTDLAGCSFSFEIMDGAVRVSKLDNACVFKAADCQADPSGIWGPSPKAFGPDKVAELNRNRAAAEGVVRKDYKVLMEKAHKAKGDVKPIAQEQAGFSSERAQVCADYLWEDRHSFCTTTFTEARAAVLAQRLNGASGEAGADKPKKPRRRKPAASPMAEPAAPAEQF